MFTGKLFIPVSHEQSDSDPIFIPYDDENMEHVTAGPDYGQTDSGSKETAWSELDSKEYPKYVSEIASMILLRRKFKIIA
jgi:hypothetical protein